MLKYKNEILCVSQNRYKCENLLPDTIFQKYEKILAGTFAGSKYLYLEIFFGKLNACLGVYNFPMRSLPL